MQKTIPAPDNLPIVPEAATEAGPTQGPADFPDVPAEATLKSPIRRRTDRPGGSPGRALRQFTKTRMEQTRHPSAERRGDVLMDVPTLADYLGISKETVYRLVERRTLPFHRLPGGLRFRRSDIEGYLAERRVEAAGKERYGLA